MMIHDEYKIIINGEEKTITLQDDIATIKHIFYKDSIDELTLKSIGEICNNKINFYITSYQRGYRWGKDEVIALLDDIYEVYSQKDQVQNYCLQPLVIKKCNNSFKPKQSLKALVHEESSFNYSNESKDSDNKEFYPQDKYELLDGQQRLTTLWIILDSLDSKLNPKYSIYYELLRQIDNDFIKKAKEIIEEWVKKKKKNNLEDYKKIILENIYFIWYEVKMDESTQGTNSSQGQSEKLFRKINKGKIELTNAELFKAMLLNNENTHNEKERDELIQISFEWDKIEQSLRNDDFWFFISNDSSEERTRIDYILEVYARTLDKDNKYDIGKDRYSFLVVQDKLTNGIETNGLSEFDKINKIWQEIVLVHNKLYSWYQDNELYHNIGFLVACEGKRRSIASDTIVNLYKDVKDKKGIKETRNIVKGKIYDYLVIKKWNYREEGQGRGKKRKKYYDIAISEKYELGNLSYDSDKKYIADFLLFSNIYPLIKIDDNGNYSKDRFPFKLYYEEKWDIEHINPQTPKRGNIIDDIISCGNVDLVWQYLNKCHHDEIKIKEEERNDKTLKEIWKDDFLDGGGDDIGNLVLLNSKINREYHNAIFNQKRATIIGYDKKGIFIPLATKNVFLKYYTDNPDEFIVWDNKDIEGYMNHLKEIFDEVSTWLEFSQKNNTELK